MGIVISILSTVSFTLLWSLFYYKTDPHPKRVNNIMFAIASGSIAFLLSFIIVTPFLFLFDNSVEEVDLLFSNGDTLWIVILAATEELAKLLVLWFVVFKHQVIDKHIDGVLFGGLLGLGFALVENAFYGLQLTATASMYRAVLIPILHSGTGAILGAILVERFLRDNRKHFQNIAFALFITTFFHAIYNYFVIKANSSEGMLIAMTGVWLLILIITGYVINLERFRDTATSSDLKTYSDEKAEEGNTYAYLSIILSFLTLLSIFPLIFGVSSMLLAFIAQKNEAKVWGKRAVFFSISSLVLSYIVSIVQN